MCFFSKRAFKKNKNHNKLFFFFFGGEGRRCLPRPGGGCVLVGGAVGQGSCRGLGSHQPLTHYLRPCGLLGPRTLQSPGRMGQTGAPTKLPQSSPALGLLPQQTFAIKNYPLAPHVNLFSVLIKFKVSKHALLRCHSFNSQDVRFWCPKEFAVEILTHDPTVNCMEQNEADSPRLQIHTEST